jgi:TPP-dependent pyruvate/acetoin dehydrogenase alpha subunit
MPLAQLTQKRELTEQGYLDLLHYLLLTRTLEDRLEALLKQGKIVGALFRSLGQEATAVGSAYALDKSKGDIISPLTRDLGAMLVIGALPREVFSQYLARASAPSHGRDQNLHFTDLKRGFIGTISPLGAMVAVMNGVVLAKRMKGEHGVGMVYIGDGGMNTGAFQEAANFAAAQNLPLVIIAENNGYAYTTPTRTHMRILNLADRAKGFGIPCEIVDGNDVLAVYDCTLRAVEKARGGEGPVMIEAKTFRMRGHAAHDNQSYVSKEVIDQWRKRDPIAMYERTLKDRKIADEPEFSRARAEVDSLIDQELAWAENQAPANANEAAGGVYAED